MTEIVPPASKRRRFFIDEDDLASGTSEVSIRLPTKQTSTAQNDVSPKNAPSSSSSPIAKQVLHDEQQTRTPLSKELSVLASLIGSDVTKSTLEHVLKLAKGNMEAAVNIYFDNTWQSTLPSSRSSAPEESLAQSKAAIFKTNEPFVPHKITPAPTQSASKTSRLATRQWSKRYVGCFGREFHYVGFSAPAY